MCAVKKGVIVNEVALLNLPVMSVHECLIFNHLPHFQKFIGTMIDTCSSGIKFQLVTVKIVCVVATVCTSLHLFNETYRIFFLGTAHTFYLIPTHMLHNRSK